MHRKTILASALAVLLAGATSFVMAQTTPAPTSSQTQTMTKDAHIKHGKHHNRMHRRGGHHQRGQNQRNGVISDMRALERLYMQAGRSKEMAAVYNDVLTKSQDPRVRSYATHRLARLQAQPENVDQAIATLRKGLNENLANEAKRRAEHEKMRAAWQQRADKMTPATK